MRKKKEAVLVPPVTGVNYSSLGPAIEPEFQSPEAVAKWDAPTFWRWNQLTSNLKLAELEGKLELEKHKNMEHNLIISQLRKELHRSELLRMQKAFADSKNAYAEFIKSQEELLNISFDNVVVDDITYEIIRPSVPGKKE